MPLVSGEPLVVIGPGSEWFWTAISGLVLAITFLAIYRQLAAQRSTNAFEQLRAVDDTWYSERLTRKRLAVYIALRDGAAPEDIPGHANGPLMNHWEQVGGLVRAGHVPLKLIDRMFGSDVTFWWQVLEPRVTKIRVDEAEPEIGIDFEWLARRMTSSPARGDALAVAKRNLASWIPQLEDTIREMEAMRVVTIATAPSAPAPSTGPTDLERERPESAPVLVVGG